MKTIEEKVYLSVEDLEKFYSIKKSMQAKLRMNKKIPYCRPAGSKLCLYKKAEIDEWMKNYHIAS